MKFVKKALIIMVLLAVSIFSLTGCVDGVVLDTATVFKEISVAYWEAVSENEEIDFDKPVITTENIEQVVGDGKIEKRKYSHIALKWNHDFADNYMFTVITFAITTDKDIDFDFKIMGGNLAETDVISSHTVSCKAGVPVGIALAGVFAF